MSAGRITGSKFPHYSSLVYFGLKTLGADKKAKLAISRLQYQHGYLHSSPPHSNCLPFPSLAFSPFFRWGFKILSYDCFHVSILIAFCMAGRVIAFYNPRASFESPSHRFPSLVTAFSY